MEKNELDILVDDWWLEFLCDQFNMSYNFVLFSFDRYINGKKSIVPQTLSDECIGLFKRFHLCNEHPCPESILDFREEQCISYNKQIFQGKRYVWESYIKGIISEIDKKENVYIDSCTKPILF